MIIIIECFNNRPKVYCIIFNDEINVNIGLKRHWHVNICNCSVLKNQSEQKSKTSLVQVSQTVGTPGKNICAHRFLILF